MTLCHTTRSPAGPTTPIPCAAVGSMVVQPSGRSMLPLPSGNLCVVIFSGAGMLAKSLARSSFGASADAMMTVDELPVGATPQKMTP